MDNVLNLTLEENGKNFTFLISDSITLEELSNILAESGISQSINDITYQIESWSNNQVEFSNLPNWLKEWSGIDAASYVHDNVLSGLDSAEVDAYVDNLPNTVAGMKTGLKQIGGALVAIRDILEIIARLLMYIRDLVIRFRN